MKVRIAVVDDHNLYRKGLIEILRKYSEFQITGEYSDGQDYINHLRYADEEKSDIVILDYQMPLLDGISVCRWLKENGKKVKPIIISQYKDYMLVHHFIKNGAKGYMLKDADVKELYQTIIEVYNNGFFFNEFLPNDTIIDLVQNKNIIVNFNNNIMLTDREKDIAKLICRQLSYKEIAYQLGISKRTVETHKNHILEKIGASKVTGIVVYATKKGWI